MKGRNKILIVDDETSIRQMLTIALEIAGFETIEAKNAYEAQVAITDHLPNLVLLDWMMPEVSGIELARRWRRDEQFQHIPIIILTAKSDEEHTVKGLQSGADDFITKPFSPRELIARIQALLRRTETYDRDSTQLQAGDLVMDMDSRSVSIQNSTIALGPTEYRLLEFFLRHPNRAYTRDQLLTNVWGANVYLDERTIDVHIRRLRKALSMNGYDVCIQTVRGHGYRFSAEPLK